MHGTIPSLPRRGACLSAGTTLLLPFIYLGSNLSHPHRQGIEVPQGSIVCMTLFIIAIKDIANAVGRPVTTSLYVNGITIFCGSSCLNTFECRLHDVKNLLYQWLLENGFFLSVAKTRCVYFTRKRYIFPPPTLKTSAAHSSLLSDFWPSLLTESYLGNSTLGSSDVNVERLAVFYGLYLGLLGAEIEMS